MSIAANRAEELVRDFGLSLPIVPQEVCAQISDITFPVSYHEETLKTDGVCGMSLGLDPGAAVIVNATIDNQGRKNFTGAHEIGHVVLHIETKKRLKFNCTKADLAPKTTSDFEREANEFASALLMPKSLIGPKIHQSSLTWQLIRSLKEDCDTSLEATARRVVCLSDEACALVIHKDGKMWTPIKSPSFTSSRFYIGTTPFPTNLETFPDLPLDEIPDELIECDALDWRLNGKDVPDAILYSSIRNEEHNRTMTLLVIPEIYDEEPDWDNPTF